MSTLPKKELAVAFLQSLQGLPPEGLQRLIQEEAGEGLSAFFSDYATRIMDALGDDRQRTGSTLMMLGYLIRAHEERAHRTSAADV